MSDDPVQHYEVVPGRFLAGEYPASWAPDLAMRRLAGLASRGVRVFIDLTAPEDHLEPYEDLLEDHGAVRHSFPIPDLGVPRDEELMRGVMRTIADSLAEGRACYLHCWGGIGRTGTAVGCYLRETGLGGEESLAMVQRLYASNMPKAARHPYSPQTRAQCDYVRDWRR